MFIHAVCEIKIGTYVISFILFKSKTISKKSYIVNDPQYAQCEKKSYAQ